MEAALVATARFAADKVTILVQLDEKLKAMTGIEEKMKKLKEMSTVIDMVIQDVESHPLNNDVVKDLLRKLKYLAYDLEDVVDCYDTEASRRQRSSIVSDFFSSNNQVVFTSNISDMIQGVTNSLGSILLQKSILLNLPQSSSHMSLPYRGTHSRNTIEVIGRELEKNKIVNMLTKDDDDESSHGTHALKVITIVGMGGLGKTTLAQLVFNDARVKDHFASPRMWKLVGAEFDPAKIMKSVLELATGAPVNISEIELVRQNLETALSGKRFLLVLDDVWNEDPFEWGTLKAALTCGAKGSKILVTTRSLHVCSIMGSSTATHQIQQLSRDDCLSLFQQFAFGDEAPDQKLMKIGKKIVKKCDGVPLAAISLGNMLRGTRDETYWSSVLKSEIWQLRDEEQKVLAVLKWSYDTLPLRSKKCFAFGSLFPKDYMMQKDKLIKLWIANGFVSSEGNFEAETEGNRIFDDLVSRSFILLAPIQYDPHITKCTMHDLMHDLARSVSGSIYWNSIQDLVEVIRERTYHLQIDEGKLPNMTQVLAKKPTYLRTFFQDKLSCLSINLHEVFSVLKFLRALNLTESGIREIPTSIGNLIHLRYLNLYYNEIEVLPDSITLLSNLQYLNLSFNYGLRELPKELGNMQNLRELDLVMDKRLTHIPCGLSRLTNLQSLPVFIASDKTGACSITELEDLKLYGKMGIKISHDFKNYSRSGRKILKNSNLDELHVEFGVSEGYHKDMLDDLCPNTSLKMLRISNYRSPQFPTWLIELQMPNLVVVDLGCCCGHILPFRNLQFLKKLSLGHMNGITQMVAEFHGHGGFPSLQELYLRGMYNLEEWSVAHCVDELFPLLQTLKISECPKLKSMPRLPTIQHLEISCCSESLLSCIGKLTSLSVLRVDGMGNMTSLPSGCIRNLTSLTELQIILCRQLQSLPGDEMQYLQMLRSLTIEGCYNLASFPLEVGRLNSLCFLRLSQCPSIILQPEELVQILNSVHRFEIQICGNKLHLRGRLQHLHTLKELSLSDAHYVSPIRMYPIRYGNPKSTLHICCCGELESLMTVEPASSAVLEALSIDGISNLRTLPGWLQHLKSLTLLSIRKCIISILSICRGNELESLMTAEPASSTVLEKLYIDGISNLTTLPDWLQHLKSLHLLSIRDCPRLKMVPRDLKNLHMLKDLRIIGCPQLERRCKRETDEDSIGQAC
ncbi:hypothetical protein ZIOFF_041942 [Zingiber officinale]|uniref:Uncharacterized protein n=2 Tax=Zingiber officinale TaxID=94328 RepID=A0A8J5G8G8_ZINOF|nr:hypothetical protein ZIOFF_041942 [Zingiber officinale]